MAVEGEEVEYESDPENALLPTMRRREASDDEDAEGSDGRHDPARKGMIGSDGESDGQGGAQVYDEEEEFYPEDEEEFEGEEVEGELDEEENGIEERSNAGAPREADVAAAVGPEIGIDGGMISGKMAEDEREGKDRVEEEEKKENEPYAVPTAGAFYMHDDRFRENGRGRHRRFPGDRKLWEFKDDQAWVHDRFEELNLQEARLDEERRTSRGRFRGRGGGKTRGSGRGYTRGSRSRAYDDSSIQNHVPKSVRGRGPRRYETLPKNRNEMPATSNKRYAKSHELMPSSSNTGKQSSTKQSSHNSNVERDLIPPQKHVYGSSLSSASPPFYPSASSNQDISVNQKKDAQTGVTNRMLPSSMQMEETLSSSQSGPLMRGKASIDSAVDDRLYRADSIHPIAAKTLSSSQVQTPVSSLSLSNPSNAPSLRFRDQGRGVTISGPLNYQPTVPLNQVARVSAQTQPAHVPQRPYQASVQPALKHFTQQMTQRPSSSRALSTTLSEVGEAESPPGHSNPQTTSVGKGQTSNQSTGRGSFLYGGAQVIGATGAMGFTHGDQNFPATPALLPFMQFGGQHGGIGVPAVGMALPGYVTQPQLGFGNSEMTWMPVLAGAAGALGASYPCITLDSSHFARPSGQTSSPVSSRETSTEKPGTKLQPSQRSEIVNDEFSQRQNKPRRYSEMNFGQ